MSDAFGATDSTGVRHCKRKLACVAKLRHNITCLLGFLRARLGITVYLKKMSFGAQFQHHQQNWFLYSISVSNVPYNMGEDQLIDVFNSVGQVIGFRYCSLSLLGFILTALH